MFVVVDIQGQQLKISEKNKYYVPRLKEEINSDISLDKVLLYSADDGVKVGAPFVDGIKVSAKVLEHLKDDTIHVFKKKRRTGYRRNRGHRQQLTRIEITKIG